MPVGDLERCGDVFVLRGQAQQARPGLGGQVGRWAFRIGGPERVRQLHDLFGHGRRHLEGRHIPIADDVIHEIGAHGAA